MNLRLFKIATLCLSVASVSFAQTNPAKSAAADETIKLEEFTVKSDRSNGYRATNSITGTGIGTLIADSPLPINVLTGEFIKDLAQTRLAEALVYVPGIQNSTYESTISIRGFSGLQLYRNGFYRRQTYTTWNIERVEVIKGAAAVFYGVLRPGGVVNYLTNKPNFDGNSTELDFAFGSASYVKASAYSNYKLNDNLAVRVGVGASDGGGWRNNEFNRQNYQSVSSTFRITKNQELNVDLEHIYWKFTDLRGVDNALTNALYYGNPAAIASGLSVNQWVAANYPGTATYNIQVPNALNPKGRYYLNGSDTWSEQESDTVDLTYRAKLTESLVFTSNVNWARDFFEEIRTISNDQSPYADGSINYQFGNFGNIRHSFNLNNKFVYRFDFAGTKNTLQIGQDLLHLQQFTPGIITSAGNFQDGIRSAFFKETPLQGSRRSGTAALTASGQLFTAQRDRITQTTGYFIMNQQELFNGDLRLLYGMRQNEVRYHVLYPQKVGNAEVRSSLSHPTPQIGALYKLTNEVSAFATYTKSTEFAGGADFSGKPVDPIDDLGMDVGLKTTLMDGRVSGTLSYNVTRRDHLASTDNAKQNALGTAPWYIYGNTAESKGIEADFNFSLTDSWSLMLGYSHDLQNEITQSTVPSQIGLPLGGVPKDYVTLWSRYDIKSGDLKGYYLTGGMRASTDARVSPDGIGLSLDNIALRPSFVVFEAGVGRRFKLANKNWSASVSVKNIADRAYREGVDGGWGSPRLINVMVGTKF